VNLRSVILIVFAVVGVALVVMLTRSFLTSAQQQSADALVAVPQEVSVRILVAKKDLPVGTILTADHAEWRDWPEKGVAASYYSIKKDKKSVIVDQVVRSPLTMGEPFTRTAIVKRGDRGFFAAILSPGMRAVTVKLSPTSGIGGFIFPGDRVDVILTHTLKASRDEEYQIAETVFQNVRILAVDQKTTTDDAVKIGKTATIEVTPKMAEKVAMLTNIGTLSLSLRALANDGSGLPSDPNSPPISQTTSFSLGDEVSKFLPKLGAAKTEEEGEVVRVTRGSSVTTVSANRKKDEGSDQ